MAAVTRHVDTCAGRIQFLDSGPRRPGPREQVAELREALAVLETENRSLRERVERLERQFDAAMVAGGPDPEFTQETR